MKNLPLILSSLALIGVGFLLFKSNTPKKATTVKIKNDSTGVEEDINLTRIAFVDIDTVQENYKYFLKKKAEFEARAKKIENELSTKSKALENEYASLQKKAQAGSLTQAEGENIQKSLITKQENLQKLEKNLSEKLFKERDDFNEQFTKDMKDAVKQFNKDNAYDYVLINGSSFLYTNASLDVTQDVLEIMNNNGRK